MLVFFENDTVTAQEKADAADLWWLQFASRKDTDHPVLRGIHAADKFLETSDGVRLHRVNKKHLGKDGVVIVNEGKKVNKSFRKGTSYFYPTETYEGRYPRTEMVFPKGEPVFVIGVNAKLLAEALSIPSKGKYVKLSFYGPEKPILVESKDTVYQAVVMPVYLESDF